MPRKGPAPKRQILPDGKFNSKVLARFINKVMLRGKKSTAENITYAALEIIAEKTGRDPMDIFSQALSNAMPLVEVRPRRVGGATYQVPMEVRPDRRQAMAMRWLIGFAALARRPLDGGKARQRAARRLQQHRRDDQEARRHAQDGRSQQSLRPLPLVTASKERKGPWLHGNIRSSEREILALPRTSMPARRRVPNAFCSIPAACTKSAKCTTAPRRWTGWCRSRNAALRSRRRRPQPRGAIPVSILSIRLGTLTSRSKSNVRCACSTVWSRSSIRLPPFSRSPKRFGVRRTNIKCRASSSSTRWTGWVPISSTWSTRFANG